MNTPYKILIFHCNSILFFKYLIGGKLLYNVCWYLPYNNINQSDINININIYIYISPLPLGTLFLTPSHPSTSSQCARLGCLCYIATSHWLAVLPRELSGKELPSSAETAGNTGLIPGWGRSPGGGNGNPLQYSCRDNPMDR